MSKNIIIKTQNIEVFLTASLQLRSESLGGPKVKTLYARGSFLDLTFTHLIFVAFSHLILILWKVKSGFTSINM